MRVHASAVAASKKEVLVKIKTQLKTAQKHLQEMEPIEPGEKQRHKPADGICDNPHAQLLHDQVAKQLEMLPEVPGKLYRVLVNLDTPPGDQAEYSSCVVSCDMLKPAY